MACHENLEALLSPGRGELLHAISLDAPALEVYRASLPGRALVPFRPARTLRAFLNDDGMLRHSDLGSALLRSGAGAFLPSYRASALQERWGARAGLRILSPPYALQRALEDKVRFQALLEAHGLPAPRALVLTAAAQIPRLPGFPLVCQRPRSEGMEGTHLVASPRQLHAQLEGGALRLPLLCREFVRGQAQGVTLVVGAREHLLSAARVQIRRLDHRAQDLAGVQWLPSAALTPRARRNLARAMAGLGEALRQAGFLGAASVDYMLRGDEVLLIECNPRFSSATPQLAQHPGLLHGLDLVAQHLRAVRGQRLGAHRPGLPPTRFEGTYLDFGDWAAQTLRAAGRRLVRALPRLGVHDLGGGRLRYVSPDVAQLRGPWRLLYHCSSPPGRRLNRKTDLGSLFTNFPLFAPQRAHAALTPAGAALLHQLLRAIPLASGGETLAHLATLPDTAD